MNHTLLEQDHCPACKKPLDAASPVDGEAVPSPNDLSVCIYCGAWNKYGENMKLVALTKEEKDTMNPVLQKQMDEISARITEVKKKLN